MTGVSRAAGAAGIAAAILFVILLGTTFSYDPGAYSDPVEALAFAQQAKMLRTVVGLAGVLSGIALVVFFAGLGERLAAATPLWGMVTRYFGALGGTALALGSLVDWVGINVLTSFKDLVAAQHAWVALFAFNAGVYGLAGAFMGIAVLAAGTTMIRERIVSASAGWVAVAGAVVILLGTILQGVLPADTPWLYTFYIVAGVLLLVWFAWTGVALRRA